MGGGERQALTSPATAEPPGPARPGRALVLWGSTLVTAALLVATIGYSLTLGRVDVAGLRRDVVLPERSTATVPGELAFRVTEPLRSGESARMRVGVAVSPDRTRVRCRVSTAAGAEVPVSGPGLASQLVREPQRSFNVVVVADLGPGDYRARCAGAEGEAGGGPGAGPAAGTAERFTVGRTLASDDVRDVLGPFLWFLVAAAPAAILFVVGTVLLVLGLVRRSRSGGIAPG